MAAAEEQVDNPSQQTPFAQTPFGRNIILGGGIALVLAIMVAVWMWSQAPEYRILFANYSDRDG
ncbi:MAG: flagellar basal body M-ring protein FliF, partial [Massilia sp.]|nr:flagellar basal body M-ring protein FliF [Massilia sp.]